jgi:hypothetical protein
MSLIKKGAPVVLAAALAAVGQAAPASATVGQTLFGNVHSGLCLEVFDWRTDNLAPVGQGPCSGAPNQEWDWR